VSQVARVSFLGAGPGDPELVTLKALRRLREADVVIRDRLVPVELLHEVRPDAEIIDAGKAPGRHCLAQVEINWLLVDRARRRGRVVRLKGGDPAVFGRLAEEIDAVRSAGIPFEIIPGVTAATAAAARAGISLTERGHASMLVFATATDHTGRAPSGLDWDLLARAEGTLVFYMGVRALETITASLTVLGRDPREPAILVERVGGPDERIIAGRLGEIAAAARAAGAASPAVLITGPTVATASAPLSVRRIAADVAAPSRLPADVRVGGPDMAPHASRTLGSAPAEPWRSSVAQFVHGA
jgi:uroporphyrin-III C-methyltransferase